MTVSLNKKSPLYHKHCLFGKFNYCVSKKYRSFAFCSEISTKTVRMHALNFFHAIEIASSYSNIWLKILVLYRIETTSGIVKKYCLENNGKFVLPSRNDVVKHRVVVTALSTSRILFDLKLGRGFFSHILIDEAAQALEPETVSPVTLAGPNTKVVFTGDHMQVIWDNAVYEYYLRLFILLLMWKYKVGYTLIVIL